VKPEILMSRTIGGMRTGDLNTLRWDAFDPEFTTCTFVRRKTRKKKPAPQALEVPEAVRPFIKAW
jgi:integrase